VNLLELRQRDSFGAMSLDKSVGATAADTSWIGLLSCTSPSTPGGVLTDEPFELLLAKSEFAAASFLEFGLL
jgi:hypothetical protein